MVCGFFQANMNKFSLIFLVFQVFAGVYPVDMSQYVSLRNAIEKLTLNDASVTSHPDSWYVNMTSPFDADMDERVHYRVTEF